MVGNIFIIQSVESAKGIMSAAEQLTIVGLLVLVIVALGLHIKGLKKEHKEERDHLRQEVKQAREQLDDEYKESNKEMKIIAEHYHVTMTKIFDKLNLLLK